MESPGVAVAAASAVRHMAMDKPNTQTFAIVSTTSAIVEYCRLCVECGSGWSLDDTSLYLANMVLANAQGSDRKTLQKLAYQILTMASSVQDARSQT
jgi:hypothetical protein